MRITSRRTIYTSAHVEPLLEETACHGEGQSRLESPMEISESRHPEIGSASLLFQFKYYSALDRLLLHSGALPEKEFGGWLYLGFCIKFGPTFLRLRIFNSKIFIW